MESVKKEVVLWVCIVVMLLIWVGVLQLTSTPLAINWEAVKKLPDVVTIFVIISFAFTKWLWRLRFFRGWLVRVPDLHVHERVRELQQSSTNSGGGGDGCDQLELQLHESLQGHHPDQESYP